ncbi:MAG: OmpA family protein [Ignavibacteria bacterium]|nr:OmpA family protein [Ignavibacteria bacterium]
MKQTKIIAVVSVLMLAVLFYGCGTSKAFQGTAIGAGGGAVIGGVIGNQYDNTALGAIIGAVVGGTAGAFIGDYMDDQAEEINNDIAGAKTERVGEGIKITFDSGILFATNSSTLQDEAKANISKLSTILNKYPDTKVLIVGHTDSDGSDDYNQTLSEKRAASVSSYAISKGVASSRIEKIGLGEKEPVATNDTADGKKQNRRVEIAIFANEELKEAAEKGQLKP